MRKYTHTHLSLGQKMTHACKHDRSCAVADHPLTPWHLRDTLVLETKQSATGSPGDPGLGVSPGHRTGPSVVKSESSGQTKTGRSPYLHSISHPRSWVGHLQSWPTLENASGHSGTSSNQVFPLLPALSSCSGAPSLFSDTIWLTCPRGRPTTWWDCSGEEGASPRKLVFCKRHVNKQGLKPDDVVTSVDSAPPR